MYRHKLLNAKEMSHRWETDPRWAGIQRDYSAEDVVRLRGSVHIESTLARLGAEKLWRLLRKEPYVHALGAVTGNQALQMVTAGLKAIYLSGWQVAADANLAGQMYPDQSLYPSNSAPALVRSINNTFRRADQIHHAESDDDIDFFAPIVADAEAGFGGPLNAFEIMKAMIEAGAAGVHFEDQLSSEKKCGHMGGKVLVPTSQHIRTLNAARLAADVMDVPTLLIARTDANGARLLTSDIDERDRPFLTGERTAEGFYQITGRPGSRDRPRSVLCSLRRPSLVRDVDARPGGGSNGSPRRSRTASPASSWPTTARPPSTGRPSSMKQRSPASSASSGRWATSSSSSPWPASTS